jgi:N-methylhydantoinase A
MIDKTTCKSAPTTPSFNRLNWRSFFLAQHSVRLGVDIGGTFTDVVLEVGTAVFSAKVLTTYTAPEEAIIAGLQQVCDKAGVAPFQIEQVIHGTTLATNALIERRGAKTALITSEGFRSQPRRYRTGYRSNCGGRV